MSNDHNEPINSVPYLPTVIIIEILSRVGIKTLFNCRLVCKSWADLIFTPEFAQLHLSRSPTTCLIKPLNIEEHQFKGLHLVDLDLCNKFVLIPKINLPDVPLTLINSCNGLCLCRLNSPDPYTAGNIYVCNPVLGEYITLPKPPHITYFYIPDCALGFSHKTNQYKVVLSSYHNSRTDIYTLGKEGSWRRIENAPYFWRSINTRLFNVFLNGALHWIPFGLLYPFICCFDFETEQFRQVPEPSQFAPLKKECSYGMTVGVISGNLSICDFRYGVGEPIVIWVMKDYGVKESWSKDFVITYMINETHHEGYKPIMITGNGEIFIVLNNECIMLYDAKSETFESEMQTFGADSKFHAIAHVPSLISLKDVAKGEKIKVTKPRSFGNRRWKMYPAPRLVS